MTFPYGLIHHWDPSVDQGGRVLKDIVGGVDGTLGRWTHAAEYDPKIEQELRLRPNGFTKRLSRQFWTQNEDGWTDPGSTATITDTDGSRSPNALEFIFPGTVPSGVKTTCRAESPSFTETGDKWIYVDFYFRWQYLKFPASGIVKFLSLRSGGNDKLWFGLEPQRDAGGAIDLRYNDLADVEKYGCFYFPNDTKLSRNQNTVVQVLRWNVNRVQILAKLGSIDGEAHLYVNETLVASHTGLNIGAESEWDQVHIAPVWGQIGDGNYEDSWRFSDRIRCHHIWVGTGNPTSISWPSHTLHKHEPSGFVQLHETSYDGVDPGVSYTEDHNAHTLSTGYSGFNRNYPYQVKDEYFTPMMYHKRPSERFGAGAERIFHKAASAGTTGTWFAHGQLTATGDNYIGGWVYCHDNLFGKMYGCLYFKAGNELVGAEQGVNPTYGIFKKHSILHFVDDSSTRSPAASLFGISLDFDTWRDPDSKIYLQFITGVETLGPRVEIERDRIYKIELWAEVNNVGIGQSKATISNVKWWLDEDVQYDGAYDPEAHAAAINYDNNFVGIRYTGWADYDFPNDGHWDIYYAYVSGDPSFMTSKPLAARGDWKAPWWLAGPPSFLSCGPQGGRIYLGTDDDDVFSVEYVKLPIDGKDGFWVGEDRHDYAIMFLVKECSATELDQYLIDSWDDSFDNALPSIVWAGGSTMRARGRNFSASGGVAGKIQLNWTGNTWYTITDTPTDSNAHTLTVVSRRYTTQRLEFYLDGVLVHERDWEVESDGRWFAGSGNNSARNGNDTNGDITLFGDCLAAGRSISSFGEDSPLDGNCATERWRGGLRGKAGPVLMWDRPIMPEEVKQAHEHLRATYTTLATEAPVATTPTDPVFSTYTIVSNILIDLAWSASTDPGGADVQYEVESSTDSGQTWKSFRTVDNIEPGKLTKLQVSTRNFYLGTVRFRVRGYNGINYSQWDEGADLEVTKWPKLLARSPARGGGWYDGITQYPGTRLADEIACINSDGTTYDLTQDGVSPSSIPKPEFYIAYEAPPGSKITHIHFWDFQIENGIDYIDIWIWDEDSQSWETFNRISRDFSESVSGYYPLLQVGWWGEHWAELDPFGSLVDPTKIGFGFVAYEANSWYPDQDTIGFAVDMVKITGDVPDGEEEDASEVSIQGGCADYEQIWLHAPVLNDIETGFIPGDTHEYVRQVKGFGALTIVGDANFEIVRYQGESPVYIAKTITPFDNGDGSYDFQLLLSTAETESIGHADAFHYQLRFTLSDGSTVTPNAGLIKGVPFEVVV